MILFEIILNDYEGSIRSLEKYIAIGCVSAIFCNVQLLL